MHNIKAAGRCTARLARWPFVVMMMYLVVEEPAAHVAAMVMHAMLR